MTVEERTEAVTWEGPPNKPCPEPRACWDDGTGGDGLPTPSASARSPGLRKVSDLSFQDPNTVRRRSPHRKHPSRLKTVTDKLYRLAEKKRRLHTKKKKKRIKRHEIFYL